MERKFTIEAHGTKRFMVYQLEEEKLDTLTLGMLTNNQIPGLAAVSFAQMDARKLIRYDISARVSAKELFEGIISKKHLLGVLSGIADALISADEYMISSRSFLLNPNYIFVNPHSGDTVLICLPENDVEQEYADLKMFFKMLLFKVRSDQREVGEYINKIRDYLNEAGSFSVSAFKEMLKKLDSSGKSVKSGDSGSVSGNSGTAGSGRSGSVGTGSSGAGTGSGNASHGSVGAFNIPGGRGKVYMGNDDPVDDGDEDEDAISLFYLLQHYNKDNAAKYKAQQEKKKAQKKNGTEKDKKKKKDKVSKKAEVGFVIPGAETEYDTGNAEINSIHAGNDEHEVVHQGDSIDFGATTMLDDVQESAYLIREKNGEKISLEKPVFYIGKHSAYSDYTVTDNPAVSRRHAKIVCRNGQYFIVDLESTNHTKVMDARINANEEVELEHGCKLTLANEKFEFRLF